ncbi:SDR family oxidoreductase [Oenococcus sp. UCMA 17063]|nr:SDR family oxidoreductase [Oenococcus sp. UCMA 17063]
MQERKIALITGANKGIGLQIAKDLVDRGLTVFIGSRNLERGKLAAQSIGGNATAIQLDVTDQESVNAAAKQIQDEVNHLDVLVNNAGILFPNKPNLLPEEISAIARIATASLNDIRTVYETNVFGVIAVTQAMLPLLRKSSAARVVNISSAGGSLTLNSDSKSTLRPMYSVVYSPSKTALNAITLAFAIELESTNIKVNAVSPGFTATDFNHFSGTRTVQQAAREPVRLALLDEDGPTGTFSDENGQVPW